MQWLVLGAWFAINMLGGISAALPECSNEITHKVLSFINLRTVRKYCYPRVLCQPRCFRLHQKLHRIIPSDCRVRALSHEYLARYEVECAVELVYPLCSKRTQKRIDELYAEVGLTDYTTLDPAMCIDPYKRQMLYNLYTAFPDGCVIYHRRKDGETFYSTKSFFSHLIEMYCGKSPEELTSVADEICNKGHIF